MSYADDILKHYGVKGQHWGVRKSPNAGAGPARPQTVKVTAKPGKRIKTSGGGGHGVSKEAKTTAITNQKAKASKVHALTNKELEAAVKRMRLEQQYSELASQRTTIGRGKSFVKSLKGGKKGIDNFNSSAAGKSLKASLAKKAVVAAVL